MTERRAPAGPGEVAADAAELGVWLLVVSEVLLFAGLAALYVTTRLAEPEAFTAGIAHMNGPLGALNTALLLTSSVVVALATTALEADRRRVASGLVLLTLALGATFLAVKVIEYRGHLAEGLGPTLTAGGARAAGLPRAAALFVSLYWLTTALHGLHVLAGLAALAWAALRLRRPGPGAGVLPLVAVYWHFVDVVWIFVWPAFYLGGPR